jgi:predicted MFS family arabinose efflux permease
LPAPELALLALFYCSYMLNIFATNAVELALPLAAADPAIHLGIEELSRGMAVGQVATVFGKLAAGFVLGWRGAAAAFPEMLMVMGLMLALGAGAMQAGMPASALCCFVLLKVAKAPVYTSMAMATRAKFDPKLLSKIWGVLSTSSRAGAVLGSWVLGPLAKFGWLLPVLTVGILLCLTAAVLWWQMAGRGKKNKGEASGKAGGAAAQGSMFQALGLLRQDKQLWLLFLTMGMCLPVMECSAQLPLLLSQRLHIDVPAAARLASAFPLGMVVATFGGGFVLDVLTPQRKVLFLAATTGSGAAAFLALGWVDTAAAAGFLLFWGGAGIAPAQYLAPSVYIMRNVDERHAGTILTMMDIPAYMVSAVVFAVYPMIIEEGGPAAYFAVLAGMAAVATVAVVAQQVLQARAGALAKPKAA